MLTKSTKVFNTFCNKETEFVEANIQADKLMLNLAAIQWLITTFITSHMYDTYMYGFISGGLLFLISLLSFKLYKGTRMMMAVSAIVMMLFSLIYIQQFLGRIEMHFHVFIGMAILSVYTNITPIIVATVTTTLHHLVFNYLQLYDIDLFDMPIIVFNYGCGLDIVFLHAIFVFIEASILIYIINIKIKRTLVLMETRKELKVLNENLKYSSGHDTLTGLSNRKRLNEQMEYIIANANRYQSKFAVIFLDLDYFKNINDTLGHNIGDKLLQDIAQKFKSLVRKNDIVSRIGGDEFVIVAVDVEDITGISYILEKLMNIFKKEILIDSHQLRLSSSIGVSIFPDDSSDFTELMKYADIAMYKAKDLGRNNFKFFTSILDNELHEEVELLQDMQEAIKNEEFELYYQPKVNIKTGRIIGAEALLRWEHPKLGFVSPAKFIPLAENTGFILDIGSFVIKESTRYLAYLDSLGHNNINISINVSARQFQHSDLYRELKTAISTHKINAKQLSIEVTETVMMDNIGETIKKLDMISKLNIGIHMDDFGTGYSSLSYLQQLPVDTLKIDKSFVDMISEHRDNDSLVLNTIVAMGEMLNLDIIVEGIESKYQLEYLKNKENASYQGYYFSKAIREDSFIQLLESDREVN